MSIVLRWPRRFDSHLRELLSHASAAFVIKVLAALLSFGLSVALARLLGAQDTGYYYLVFTTVTMAALIARSGIDRAALRFVAAAASEAGDVRDVARVYRLSVAVVVLCGAAATALVIATSDLLAVRLFSIAEVAPLLALAAWAITPMALFNLHAELLKGLKRTGSAIALQSAWLPALTLAVLAFSVPAMGLRGAVIAFTAGALLTMLIGAAQWWSGAPAAGGNGAFRLSELLQAGRPLFWVGIFQLIISSSATFILGMFHDGAQIGLFAVASRTAMLTSFVLFAVNSIAAPKFAELYKQQNMAQLQATAIHSATLMAVMAAPLLLLFVLAPAPVMRIFGEEFAAGATVLSWLAIGQFVNVVTGSVGYLLAMTGHGEILKNTLAISAALHLAICFFAIPRYGSLGAAAATAFTMILMNLISAYFVWRRLRIVTLPLLSALFGRRHK